MITQFDSVSANTIHGEAAELLKPLAEKYGVRIIRAGGQIDGARLVLKFELRAEGEEAEKLEFAKLCGLFQCKPGDYGREATINGKACTLIGFDLKRRKFPVRCRHAGGVMLYTEEVLKKHFHTGE